MKAKHLVPAAVLALILAEPGCGDKASVPGPEEKAFLTGKIGGYDPGKVPLELSFAPSSPFVRVPLLLAEATTKEGFSLKARLPLRGIRRLDQVGGRTWTLEEGLLLTLPGEKEPRTLAEAKITVELLDPSPQRPRLRCRLEGALFAPDGKEEPFRLLLEGPPYILDGRLHPR